MCFFAVRRLSRAATLKRFWNLRQETKLFMESNHKNVAFLCDENCLNDIAFLTDITQHLSQMNLKLQGKHQFVNMLFEHICALKKLFQVQFGKAILTHFLQSGRWNFMILIPPIMLLRDEFTSRFPEFR